jgi:hypothetical protein
VPYVITIILGFLSVGLWYYKLNYKDALSTSYNSEIRLDGQQELFTDVYRDYASTVSGDEAASIDSAHKSVHHAEVEHQLK